MKRVCARARVPDPQMHPSKEGTTLQIKRKMLASPFHWSLLMVMRNPQRLNVFPNVCGLIDLLRNHHPRIIVTPARTGDTSVIPAQAGIQLERLYPANSPPAYAGVTVMQR